MCREVSAPSKRFAAALNVTDEGSLARVSPLMSDEVATLSKRLAAALNVTEEGSLARVNTLVCHEVAVLSKRLAATLNAADEGSPACLSANEFTVACNATPSAHRNSLPGD